MKLFTIFFLLVCSCSWGGVAWAHGTDGATSRDQTAKHVKHEVKKIKLCNTRMRSAMALMDRHILYVDKQDESAAASLAPTFDDLTRRRWVLAMRECVNE